MHDEVKDAAWWKSCRNDGKGGMRIPRVGLSIIFEVEEPSRIEQKIVQQMTYRVEITLSNHKIV